MATRFAGRLLRWFDRHGRHDLPWQHPRTAYRVWVSEIMLQQTQVATVVPYYRRFLQRFPSIRALATARADTVLAHWSGLGYYARARNLHRAARLIQREHGGRFPQDFESVAALPGIGRSTAGAILAQAFGQRHAILDGNVRRVLARHSNTAGWPGTPAIADKLWMEAEQRLPHRRLADYTQALMDLGATVCTARNPDCRQCPVRSDCGALAHGTVEMLPTPKARTAQPRRKAHVLLIGNGKQILLERRPPAGIWGGLWCLPVVEGGWPESARDYGASPAAGERMPTIKHSFSHFDLELQPVRLVANGAAAIREPAARWFTLPQALKLGLPAPIRKLLESMA